MWRTSLAVAVVVSKWSFCVSVPGTALAASRAHGRIGGRPPALDAIKVTAAKARPIW
jgi:hypothetical protein